MTFLGGLIERFIFTVQRSFESEIRASSPVTLAELNQKFSAWLEVHYHQSIHSEIGQTPKQQYQQGLEIIRRVDLPKVLPLFMNRYDRTVDHNYSDVRVKNSFYRVDPKFRGDRVCVLINPFDNKDHALIYSKDDVFLGQGILYHREYGQKIEPYQQDRTRFDYLGLLQKKHQQQLDQGIDYSKLHYRKWPFDSLLQTLSHYLGRKGGVSAFTSYEHEILWDLWQHQHFCESLVITAWQNSFPKNFNCFIAEFRNLLQQKEI